MRKLAGTLAAAILAALLAAGMVQAADKVVKIGVIYPLTGGAAAEGRELRAGAELAQEIANTVSPGIDMEMAKNGGLKALGGGPSWS